MGIRTHVCDIANDALENREGLPYPVLRSNSTLFSGRLFQLDANYRATDGITTPFNPAFIARYGVEHPSVRGAKALSAAETGSWPSTASGNATVVGVPLRPGLIILTTEYHTTGSYAANDPVTGVTGNGKFREASADALNETIGFVLEEGWRVNQAYNTTRKMIKIYITRSGYGL